MTLRYAVATDVPRLVELREEAAEWLAQRGSDQWATAWPDVETMTETIAKAVDTRETWVLELDNAVTATISLNARSWPGLWSSAELSDAALYVHRLIVARECAGLGLGSWLLDWGEILAARQGTQWLRADVWTTNTGLHRYYRSVRFDHIRTVQRDDYPSGALFQRRVSR